VKIETAPEYSLQTYGTVDPTGTADSTAAILGALAAAAANPSGGVVDLGPGLFKITEPLVVNSPLVSLCGAGRGATTLVPTSALDSEAVLTVQMSPFGSGDWLTSGTFAGFTIDGSATTSAVGFQYGDVVGGRVDVGAQNFRGGSGVGVHLVNKTNWTEENFIRIFAQLCDVNVKIENTGAYNSFGYNDIDIFSRVGGGLYNGQVGVQIVNTAYLYNGRFRLTGNMTGTDAVMLQSVVSGETYGGLQGEVLDIAFEVNAADSGLTPIQTTDYFLFSGHGRVDTALGADSADSSIASPETCKFDGFWNVAGASPGSGIYQTFGEVFEPGLPTSDPGVAGQHYSVAGVVHVSAG